MDNRLHILFLTLSSLIMIQAMLHIYFSQKFRRRRELMLEEMEHYRATEIRKSLQRLLVILCPKPKHRRMWKRKRSHEWWEEVVPKWDDEEWLENFRMRKGTFKFLCSKLEVILAPHPDPVIRTMHGLSVEKIVAIALYKLASVAEYKYVANQFGVHKSTVHNCLYAFCYAVTQLLSHEFIKMPDATEAKEIAARFEKKCCFPQVIGAIDGSHIPITAPEDGHADFVNRKFYCSLVLQAIVDDQFLFRDVSCTLPGACHDADVLKESKFFKNVDKIMPQGKANVNGMDIPFLLLGDPAYPLQPWLIKNYAYDANISREKDSFNVYLNRARIVVEQAFGRLKGRWRVLLKRTEIHYTFVPTMVAACCILHNICEMSRESFQSSWLNAVEEADKDFPQMDPEVYEEGNTPQGADIREHLTAYLAERFELLQSIRGRYARQ